MLYVTHHFTTAELSDLLTHSGFAQVTIHEVVFFVLQRQSYPTSLRSLAPPKVNIHEDVCDARAHNVLLHMHLSIRVAILLLMCC